jgi:Sortase domain
MNQTKTPPKISGFRLQNLWRLRYRFYAIVVILILPIILYSSDTNVKDNVSVDAGYEVLESNLLASRVVRQKSKNQYLQKSVEDSNLAMVTKKNDQKTLEKPIPASLNIIKNTLKAFDNNSKHVTDNFLSSAFYQQFLKSSNVNSLTNLETFIKQPEVGIKYSWLSFPKYKVQAPIQWADFEDLFEKKDDQYDFNKLRNTSELESPVQKKLEKGIVHLGYTVQPGEIGNSYIVGHSSNYSTVKSDYNTIFKPLEMTTKNGDEFTIYDQKGRELKFCVFDNLKIPEEDIKTAYQDFGTERVVTLQTSILGWRNGKIEATHRWLIRAKLCNIELTSTTSSSSSITSTSKDQNSSQSSDKKEKTTIDKTPNKK